MQHYLLLFHHFKFSGQIKSRADLGAGDFRLMIPRFSEENFHKNLEIVTAVQELAKKKGVTPGQIALAWCLAQVRFFII